MSEEDLNGVLIYKNINMLLIKKLAEADVKSNGGYF